MTEQQKINKLTYLRQQKENPTGNYRKYLVRVYEYILNDSKEDNRGWSKANTRKLLDYVYDGRPDHMGYELLKDYKKTLKELGYIKFVREDDEWHTYITKELDF